ncbi:hypothetical protein M0R04_10465 [Candidatus Dojkabacteria bacterium]|jgi:phage FluMu protein Com|nr:hypothetical protein [Candidatus Dojkabacteria bacterium]
MKIDNLHTTYKGKLVAKNQGFIIKQCKKCKSNKVFTSPLEAIKGICVSCKENLRIKRG